MLHPRIQTPRLEHRQGSLCVARLPRERDNIIWRRQETIWGAVWEHTRHNIKIREVGGKSNIWWEMSEQSSQAHGQIVCGDCWLGGTTHATNM